MTDPADHDYGSWHPRKIATVTTPCHACGAPIDLHGEHQYLHPFGRSRPRWYVCSDDCAAAVSDGIRREAERVAS